MASDAGPKPAAFIPALNKIFNSAADSNIAHLNRVLSTHAGIDSTLMFVGYTLAFTSAQLNKVLDLNLSAIADKVAANASKTLKPGETVITSIPVPRVASRIADISSGMKIFSGMCSEVRMFMRLFGLLKMWSAVKSTYQNPPKDTVLLVTAWLKLACASAYYALEHKFYLGSKGVIKGYKPEELAKTFKTSIWIYGGYIVFDYISLYRQHVLQQRAPASEKVTAAERQVKDNAWWRALYIDAVYTPLTFHWGLEGGTLSDSTVGLLGAFGGFVGLREAWRATA